MKIVKTAVMVIGVVAAVATGLGAIGVIGAAGIAGVSLGTIAAVGTLASVASMALNFLAPPKPGRSQVSGTQTQFRLDPQAGIPYAIGRTATGGLGAHRDTWGPDNKYHGVTIVWSGGGPIQEIEQFRANQEPVSFSGAAAVGKYAGFMWLNNQLGEVPSPALASPVAGFPGWTAAHKLSGYAASVWVAMFDTKQNKFAAGLPNPLAIIRGVKVYDPRLDSTYPGGSGPCRALDESTYVGGASAENPWCHALTWALGRWQLGKKVLGVGMALAAINVPSFVDAANVADANGWKIGGVVSSTDDKFAVLEMMAQAGGGQPNRLGAKLTAFVNAPRVSLATIRTADLVGRGRIAATQMQRHRINGVVPVYRSEAHGWEMVPAAPVRFPTYVAEDGKRRTEETEFHLVQGLTQAAELAAYEVLNSREIGPIDLPLGIKWVGLEPGDQVTIDIPELSLNGQPAVALVRGLDPTNANVNVSFRSETTAKHDVALGRTTTVPPSPSLAPRDLSEVAAPGPTAWKLEALFVQGEGGAGVPVLAISGATDNSAASHVLFEYRPVGNVGWIQAGMEDPSVTLKEIGGVAPGQAYEAAVSYVVLGVRGARRILPAVVTTPLVSSDSAGDQLAEDLEQLERDLETANAAIEAAEGVIAGLLASMSAAEAAILAAGGEINTVRSSVQSLGSIVAGQGLTISGTAGDLAQLSSTVSTLGGSVSQQATAISNLTTDFASLEFGITATFQGESLSLNPRLAWKVGDPFPQWWSAWASPTIRRITDGGPDQPQYVGIHVAPGVDGGLATVDVVYPPGWYVMEADVELGGGGSAYSGSGLTLHGYPGLHFAAEPDSAGRVGDTITGRRFFSKLMFTPEPLRNFHLMAGWSGFAGAAGIAAKEIFVRRARIRQATAEEIRSGTVIPGLQASVTGHSTAIATLDTTVASHGTTIASHNSSITTQGQTLSNLGTSYASLNATVAAQAITISDYSTAINTTQNGVTTLLAKRGWVLDVNGYATGIEQFSNGVVSAIKFRADLLEISSPNGGARTEYSGGNWRVYHPNGVMATRMGVWS